MIGLKQGKKSLRKDMAMVNSFNINTISYKIFINIKIVLQ